MQNPSIIRNALTKINDKRIYYMQQHLKLVSDMFAVRSGGSPFNMQTKLLHDICDVTWGYSVLLYKKFVTKNLLCLSTAVQ